MTTKPTLLYNKKQFCIILLIYLKMLFKSILLED